MEPSANPSEPFNWASVAPGDEHYVLALEAYNAGQTFPEIVSLLERRGLSPELIPEVTTALARDRAFHLFAAGKSRLEVAQVLAERGLGLEDAEYIAGLVERVRDKGFASMGMGKWQTRSLIAGGVLLMAGLILYGIERLGGPLFPSELVVGLLGSGVLLAAFGGVFIAFRMR